MITLDPHVHIYDCYNLELAFNSAYQNLVNYSDANSHKVLCLTETVNENYFHLIKEKNVNTGTWEVKNTSEVNSLKLINDDKELILIAGQQIVTKEKLEILAVGLENKIPDGEPISNVLRKLSSMKCIPVLPWGVGKWTSTRKNIIENLIKENENILFYVGDNGNRPWFIPKSDLFNLAEQKGIKNLQGSDPLPISGEEKKIGSFGVILNGKFNENEPFSSIFNHLIKQETTISNYGKLESTYRFLKNQIAMQLKKKNIL